MVCDHTHASEVWSDVHPRVLSVVIREEMRGGHEKQMRWPTTGEGPPEGHEDTCLRVLGA